MNILLIKSTYYSIKVQIVLILATITKLPQTWCLEQQTFISHSSGGWEVKDEGPMA